MLANSTAHRAKAASFRRLTAAKSTDTFGQNVRPANGVASHPPLPSDPPAVGSKQESNGIEADSDDYPYSESDVETERGPGPLPPRVQRGSNSTGQHEKSTPRQGLSPQIPHLGSPRLPSSGNSFAGKRAPTYAVGRLSSAPNGAAWGPSRSYDDVKLSNGLRDAKVDDDAVSTEDVNMFRRVDLASNLSDWAPSAKPPAGLWGGISNLPEWNKVREGDPTARPIVHVQRDLDWSMRRLLNETVFEQLIQDPLGRHRFREFLAQETGTENKLDMYFDLCQYVKSSEAIRQASEALHDVYLAEDSEGHVALPDEAAEHLYTTIKSHFEVRASLGPVQQHLLHSLYKTEFQRFVKAQLVEHHKIRLGDFDMDGDRNGLGDCYCLTNPRLRENPIVLVSPGFEKVTGYPRQHIIGRNCRFLQGPGTAPDSIQRVRDALNAGEPCTELLLNYRRDGTPFFCLLSIIPLRDASGKLVYFIGAQVNVSGQLASSKGLRFLIAGGADINDSLGGTGSTVNGLEVSPSMARYLQANTSADLSVEAASSDRALSKGSDKSSFRSRRGTAAGAYDPLTSNGPTNFNEQATDNMFFSKAGGKSRTLSRMFSLSSQKKQGSAQPSDASQRLLGAESMRRDPYSIEEQMDYFSSLYGKLLIFKRDKREITFATRECIAFLGLPADNWKDIYASPLLHADLLSIVHGTERDETKVVRQAIQTAVRSGQSISVQVRMRRPTTRKRFLRNTPLDLASRGDVAKHTTIHITPLKDRDDASFAFAAVMA